jgi:uncharacterized protein YktA (UPF0223 family)
MHLKKKDWDTSNIVSQIHSLSRQCSSVYNDGFTAFELKKELYLLKEIVDSSLEDAPDFGELEKQWLTDQEKKRIIKILKS